jgi:CheY-like chemotaxis protein
MDATSRTRLNILIVDDDVGAANALGRLLRACGHTVRVSYDSREGFDLALQLKPDLILLDITMPVPDGYETARRLREVPSLAATLLIACSGSVDERKAREAGFDGWLVKPIANGDLDTVLAMVLRRINQRISNGESHACRGTRE